MLASQLKHNKALAKTHVEFAKQMLKKDVENVHLHTELKLANLRNEASQEIAGVTFEFERVEASLERVREQNECLKQELAKRDSVHAEAVAVFKAANAGLAARISTPPIPLQMPPTFGKTQILFGNADEHDS